MIDTLEFQVISWMQDAKTQRTLIKDLSTAEGKNFELIIYFFKQITIWRDKNFNKEIAQTLDERLNASIENNFLLTFYNPLKISILIVELLD
jgi:hypothetical protein